MFTITGKGTVWDTENNRPLIRFKGGKAETEDEAVAEKLKALGYTVEGEAEEKPLEKMTIKELIAYATDNKIDLGEATKKDAILAVINAALEAPDGKPGVAE